MPATMNNPNQPNQQPSNSHLVFYLSTLSLSTEGSSSSSSPEEPVYNFSAEPAQRDIHPTERFSGRNAIAVASLGDSPPVSSFAFLDENSSSPFATGTTGTTGRNYQIESLLSSSQSTSLSTSPSTQPKDQVYVDPILTKNTIPRTVPEFGTATATGGSGGGGGMGKTERTKRSRWQNGEVGGCCYYHPYSSLIAARSSHKQRHHQQAKREVWF
ncbi:hypothetical protein QBC42DRAFT_255492 [Cladorrhinum samala]|uniref:Uncharacterized protein n=1 Tax=Cladorrhinum samala TaxID=585594 RepID=A0AAV9HDY2_9PEZI|nr:hypothetical protein QBC42DRAFT_255492 [Cladorrhinum samala]